MRGTFRGEERAQIRDQWAQRIVPQLQKREIVPLLSFLPEQRQLMVMDVGANKGLWTRALLNVFGDRVDHVHLFDPSPENVRELTLREDNLAGLVEGDFERITAHQCALGREGGSMTLYTNDEGSPLASLYPHADPGWGPGMAHIRLSERIEVRVDTVDDFLREARNPKVDVLKIDTEGHEMDVLLGAERSIAEQRIALITFEFGVHQVESRHFFKDYWLHLTSRGYAIHFVDDEGRITPVTRYEYRWEQFDRNYDFIASHLPLSPVHGSRPAGAGASQRQPESGQTANQRSPAGAATAPSPTVPAAELLHRRARAVAARARRHASGTEPSDGESKSSERATAELIADLAAVVRDLTNPSSAPSE